MYYLHIGLHLFIFANFTLQLTETKTIHNKSNNNNPDHIEITIQENTEKVIPIEENIYNDKISKY